MKSGPRLGDGQNVEPTGTCTHPPHFTASAEFPLRDRKQGRRRSAGPEIGPALHAELDAAGGSGAARACDVAPKAHRAGGGPVSTYRDRASTSAGVRGGARRTPAR